VRNENSLVYLATRTDLCLTANGAAHSPLKTNDYNLGLASEGLCGDFHSDKNLHSFSLGLFNDAKNRQMGRGNVTNDVEASSCGLICGNVNISYMNIKGKVVPVPKHYAMKTYGGSGCREPLIFLHEH
jgi:hypothetical protein